MCGKGIHGWAPIPLRSAMIQHICETATVATCFETAAIVDVSRCDVRDVRCSNVSRDIANCGVAQHVCGAVKVVVLYPNWAREMCCGATHLGATVPRARACRVFATATLRVCCSAYCPAPRGRQYAPDLRRCRSQGHGQPPEAFALGGTPLCRLRRQARSALARKGDRSGKYTRKRRSMSWNPLRRKGFRRSRCAGMRCGARLFGGLSGTALRSIFVPRLDRYVNLWVALSA